MTPTTADLVAAAISENMAHPAMSGSDPLTECLAEQCLCFARPIPAEACTDLGAEPDPRAKRRFWTLYLAALLVSVIVGAASLAGCATQVVPALVPALVPVDYPGRWHYVADTECPTWRDCT